jgi:hypothetical protein
MKKTASSRREWDGMALTRSRKQAIAPSRKFLLSELSEILHRKCNRQV